MVFDVLDSWFVVQASSGIRTPSSGIPQQVEGQMGRERGQEAAQDSKVRVVR